MEEIKIYLIKDRERGRGVYAWCSPGENSRWENMVSVDDINEADYVIVVNTPVFDLRGIQPEKILYFKWEPDEFVFSKHMWNNVHPSSHKFETNDTGILSKWHINKSYDDLKKMDFPQKTKPLSWITTNLGDGTQTPDIQILEGHVLRMNFMKQFMQKHPGLLDLFGYRLEKHGSKGEISNKWYALRDYRYAFTFENSSQQGYWTEKICDAILSGCMPIYWGCPNLEDFLPPGSFVRLDLRQDDAVEKATEIVQSDYREQHLNELQEAKNLILDKWNVWPRLHSIVNKLNKPEEKESIEKIVEDKRVEIASEEKKPNSGVQIL